MAKKSRDKGKRGELEVAALLRDYGVSARRGQQFSGSPDSPDVLHSMPGIHIEVKRVEAFALYPSLVQADEDSGDDVPVVFHRRNDQPWVVVLHAEDFLYLLGLRRPPTEKE
jgi:hypothetical protein